MKPSPRLALVVLCVAAFVASLDLFIVNVAFDDIARDFGGASIASVSWVLNGYAIVYAAALVPLGRLADRFGRKSGFLAGLGLFTVASGACATSNGLWMLVAFRVLQAIGAALLTPTSMGLLVHATPVEGRARAVRIWAASGTLAAALGPVVGGLLVLASWRWVFVVNVPVGVLALALAARWVPRPDDTRREAMPDLLGAALLAVAIGALALGIVNGQTWGWSSATTIATFAMTALTLALFAWRSMRHPSPIVEASLLRVPSFAWSNIAVLTFSVGFAANLLANVLWMQRVWGFTALETGLAIAPGPLTVLIFAMLGQSLSRKISVGRVAAAGCILCAMGSVAILARVGRTPAYASALLPGWMVFGAGVGLALPTLLAVATVDLPPSRSATGSAIVTMGRQIGSVLGVSLLVALIAHGDGKTHELAGFGRVWWASAALALVAAAASLRTSARERRARAARPGEPLPSQS